MEERVIPVEDLLEADEAFCTGTAVVVNPIGSVTYQDNRQVQPCLVHMIHSDPDSTQTTIQSPFFVVTNMRGYILQG